MTVRSTTTARNSPPRRVDLGRSESTPRSQKKRAKTAEPDTVAPRRRIDEATRQVTRTRSRLDPSVQQLQGRLHGDAPDAARRGSAARFVATGEGFTAVRGTAATRKPDDVLETRDVVRNPEDANVDSTDGGTVESVARSVMTKVAGAQVASSLSTSAQANLATVRDAIADDRDAGQALDQMLADGRLSGDGEAVLDELARLSTEPLAEGLERGPLVADTVQELADPTVINQQGYGTCVPTTASIHLARNEPAEYVRLIRGLASPEGEVTLANGDRLQRENNTIDEPDDYDGRQRTQSSRLLVPALMEYGNGGLDYDPVDDSQQRDFGLFHKFVGRGLSADGMNRIMEGVTGDDWDVDKVRGDEGVDAVADIAERTRQGEDVPIAMRWGDGAHAVLVTDVDADTVHYVNPWGQEETMPRSVFEANLQSWHALA